MEEFMKEASINELIGMGAKIGAVLGGIAFLVFGLVPALYFGSTASLLFTNAFFNNIAGAGIISGAVTLLIFMIIGIFSLASGAFAGSVLGYLIILFSNAAPEKKEDASAEYCEQKHALSGDYKAAV